MIRVDWMTTNQLTWEFGGKRIHVAGHRFDLKSTPIEFNDRPKIPANRNRMRAHRKVDKSNPNAIADQASLTSVEACNQKLLEENETA